MNELQKDSFPVNGEELTTNIDGASSPEAENETDAPVLGTPVSADDLTDKPIVSDKDSVDNIEKTEGKQAGDDVPTDAVGEKTDGDNAEQTEQSETPSDANKEDKGFVDIPLSALDIDDSIKHKHTNNSTKRKKKNWSLILFIAVNVIVIAITAMFEFGGTKQEETNTLGSILNSIAKNWYFLLLGVVAFLLLYVFQVVKIALMIKASTGKCKIKPIIKSVILGKYYDNITPLAIGGQPFQAYYLSQNGVPVGTATAAPIVQLLLGTCGFLTIAIISIIFFGSSVSTPIRVMAYVGMGINSLTPLAIIFLSVLPGTTKKICFFFIKVLAKIHIIKDPAKSQEKTINTINDYRISVRYMAKSKMVIFLGYLLSIMEKFSEMSVTYFVMMACFNGVTSHSFLEMTAMTIMIYAAVSFIPTPGTAGASEGSFYVVFGSFWPMFIWRIITYYTTLALGLYVIIANGIRKNRMQKTTKSK